MVVAVRFFASLVDRTGCSEESIEIDCGTDITALWDLLIRKHPSLGELDYRPLVACDLVYSDWSASLDGVREVAFLPPVSGG